MKYDPKFDSGDIDPKDKEIQSLKLETEALRKQLDKLTNDNIDAIERENGLKDQLHYMNYHS